jgi:hypothetical protein
MKKQLQKKFAAFIIVSMVFLGSTYAQWGVNGTHIYNTNTGKVGIGTGATAVPAGTLTVKGSGGVPASSWVSAGAPLFVGYGETTIGNADYILNMGAAAANARPVFVGRRSRGTLAAPTVVSNNDFLMSFLASGYDGTAFQNPAGIDFYVDGVPTAGSVPARISFVTGANSTRAERFKIGSNGDVTTTTGNFIMGSGAKTIQFATPLATGGTAMMSMFPSGTSNADRMVIQHSSAYSNWGLQYSDALDKFNFLSGGIPVLTADLGGQTVGVGTSTPTLAKFVTEGQVGSTVALFRGSSTGKGLSLVSDWPGVYFNSYFNGNQKAMAPGYAGILNFDTDNGNLYMGTSPTAAVAAGDVTSSPAQLLLNKNGDVGIGTGAPTSRLHVVAASTSTSPTLSVASSYVGSVDVRGISSLSKTADGYGFGVYGTGGYMGGYFLADGGAYTGSDYGVYGYATGTAGTRYGVYGTASGGTDNWGGYFPTKTYTTELRVGGTQGATGFVAAINGKLIATEVRVQPSASWPDYVFGKDHILMSLEELEASINANKHLPGIPSAADVKDNGIMVGEMQTKAMEKIEENTLYILQLNSKIKEVEQLNSNKSKEMEQLNSKIKELEQKIEALTKLIK